MEGLWNIPKPLPLLKEIYMKQRDYKEFCTKIYYRKQTEGIVVTACEGVDGIAFLPDKIEGMPVVEIAPYAFSNYNRESGDLVWKNPFAGEWVESKLLCTTEVVEIHLPRYVKEIGKYAFYRCSNLKKLVLSDGILEIGGGALNGCRSLQNIEIHLWNGEKSALKSIVEEVRFEMDVRMYYHAGEREQISELLFLEHYEEAVENTPARILYTSHHGAGGYYRQCFYDREIDYKKYDALLPWAIAGDTVENVFRMTLYRLRFPYKLSDTAKKSYEEYVKNNLRKAVKYLVQKEDIENLHFLSERNYWEKEALEQGIDEASQQKKIDILSFLMEEKGKGFPKKKKTFEL